MPEPMIAPMPSAVSDHGPSFFSSRWPGSSASAISLSIDLQHRSCGGPAVGDGSGSVDVGVNGASSRMKHFHLRRRNGRACCFPACKIKGGSEDPPRDSCLCLGALGLSARHLLHFALLRPARVVARLQRILGFALLARSALGFL